MNMLHKEKHEIILNCLVNIIKSLSALFLQNEEVELDFCYGYNVIKDILLGQSRIDIITDLKTYNSVN